MCEMLDSHKCYRMKKGSHAIFVKKKFQIVLLNRALEFREIERPSHSRVRRQQGPLRRLPGGLRQRARACLPRAVGAQDEGEELRAHGDCALRGDRRGAAAGGVHGAERQ